MTDYRYDTNPEVVADTEPDPEAERIVSEIETTRSEMSSTIDEIGHRLQPQTIANEAKTKIREATVGRVERIVDDAGTTAQRTGNTLMETIRQNPVPAALAAIGVGWLALKARDQQSSYGNGWRYRSADWSSRGGGYGYEYDYSPREPGAADRVRGTAQDIADQASGRAQELGSDVQRAAQGALEDTQVKVQQAQWQAQRGLEDAQYQVGRTWNENPLALGALAVGVGAAVALAIPETQKERELMGEQRDELVRKVSSAATQVLDEAQTKAQEVTEQVGGSQSGVSSNEYEYSGSSESKI